MSMQIICEKEYPHCWYDVSMESEHMFYGQLPEKEF
jgi:hypothetical protein